MTLGSARYLLQSHQSCSHTIQVIVYAKLLRCFEKKTANVDVELLCQCNVCRSNRLCTIRVVYDYAAMVEQMIPRRRQTL